MSDVQFEDQVDTESQFIGQRMEARPRGLAGLVIKLGLVKTERQANILLLILAVAFLILAFFSPKLLALVGGSGENLNPNSIITV